jgi:hypothetical protein
MARRKVTVELELEVARANRSSAELAATLRGTKAQLEEFGDEADDASRDLDQLAANATVAKTRVDDFGDEARGSARDLEILDAKIKATELSVRRLGVAFARGGDESVGKQLNDERSMLGQLKRLRKELDDLTPRDDGGKGFLGGVAKSFKGLDFSQMVGEMRGQMIAVLVLMVAAALPTIGAMIAGTVTTAIGGATIAGAIVAASKNDQVRSAAGEFGKTISGMFFGAGNSFIIVQAILDSLAILKDGFRDLHLTDTFEIVAPYIEVMAKSLADAGRVFMPQFNAALSAGRPALGIFARDLPSVVGALGTMFRTMAESKGTLEGVHFIMTFLKNTFVAFGNTVAWLGNRFHDAYDFVAKFSGAVEDLKIPLVSPAFRWLNDQIERFIADSEIGTTTSANLSRQVTVMSGVLKTTADRAKELNDEYERQYQLQRDLITGNIDYEQALDDLGKQINDNGTSLDVHTQTGRDNQRMLLAGVEAAKRWREEMIASKMDTATANAIYQDNIDKLIAQAKAYGLDEAQVRAFIAALGSVPPVTTAQLLLEMESHGVLPGEHSGPRSGDNPDFNTDYVPPDAETAARAARAEGRRAAGGPVLAGRLYSVNEQRPEYFRPAMDGWVMPLGQSTPSGGSSGGALVVENHIEVGGEVVRVVRTEISSANRATARRVMAGV